MRENQVYTTTQYNNFIFKNGNRHVNVKHVEEIAGRMDKIGWDGAPIEVSVNEKGQYVIEEGQHRFEACKLTKTPIRFIKVRPRSTYETAVQNSMVAKWTTQDYVDAYARDGYTSYKYINNLINEFPDIKLAYILSILSKGNGGKNVTESFRKGYIKVSSDDYVTAKKNLDKLRLLKSKLETLTIPVGAYVKALTILLRKEMIDADRMAEKIEKYGASILLPVSTTKYAVDYLERLYNYRNAGKNVVYLVDAYKKAIR